MEAAAREISTFLGHQSQFGNRDKRFGESHFEFPFKFRNRTAELIERNRLSPLRAKTTPRDKTALL
jgi:hypothetical protein